MVICSQLTAWAHSLITGQTSKGHEKHDLANNTWPATKIFVCLSLFVPFILSGPLCHSPLKCVALSSHALHQPKRFTFLFQYEAAECFWGFFWIIDLLLLGSVTSLPWVLCLLDLTAQKFRERTFIGWKDERIYFLNNMRLFLKGNSRPTYSAWLLINN